MRKILNIYELALKEDLEPNGDLSTKYFESKNLKAKIIAKENGILACSKVISEVFKAYNQDFKLKAHYKDGELFESGSVLFEIEANSHSLLACERTILNFLQRTCAIATKAYQLSQAIKNYPCKVLDTRKTSPGLRELEKLAFVQGGGSNHRFNLSDAAMLKENHLKLLGLDLESAIKKLQEKNHKIIVEINQENLDKLDLVIRQNVDQILLDNFEAQNICELVKRIRTKNPQIKIEASGGINLKNIESYAKTGLDYVSSSEASKTKNLDLSMLMQVLPN